MRLTLQRRESSKGATIGTLHADGVFLCYTLEDTVREIAGRPVSEWKIHGATAIPAGLYRVTLENSPRFGPDTLTLLDVDGFQYIRMHAGNSHKDTEGCILLGMSALSDRLVGGTSRPAVTAVKEVVKKALLRCSPVVIDVLNFKGDTA